MNNKKLEHCVKRLPELISQLDGAWETKNDYNLNEDIVDEVLTQLSILLCEITEHNYGFDQCGYWQHQVCYKCNQGKYPDLIVKSCGQLREEMGSTTEEQYNAD